jgi:hypothetical protein
VIERTDRRAGCPTSADVQHKTAIRLQEALEMASEWHEPVNVLVLVGVAVLFFEV